MPEIEGMERRRTKKIKVKKKKKKRKERKKKEIRVQNEWDRTFLMRKGCVWKDGEERMTVRSERREKGIANKCGQKNVQKGKGRSKGGGGQSLMATVSFQVIQRRCF